MAPFSRTAAALLLSAITLSSLFLSVSSKDTEEPQCRLYMAQSSIYTTNRPKWGLYAGVGFSADDLLPLTELGIPLADFFEAPNRNRGTYERDIVNYVENFVWAAQYFGARWEGNFSAAVFVGGMGILANFHSGYSNVKWQQAATIHRDRQLIAHPAKPHPSRGAITSYHNLTLIATKDIAPGMELFIDFDEKWDGNFENDAFQDKLAKWDYADADKVLQKISAYMKEHGASMPAELQEDVLEFMTDKVLGAAADRRAKLIRTLLPSSMRQLRQMEQAGGTFEYRYRENTRGPEWLQKYATCVDKMKPGISKIPYAGRGAFASRKIKNKEIITPVPMIPMGSDDIFDMYRVFAGTNDQGQSTGIQYDYGEPIGKQLLYNYAFGHPESNMLLLPYGPLVTLVNHGSIKKTANAYLTWSSSDEWWNDHGLHDNDMFSVQNVDYPIITMELVAIRDIHPGEEILIDYGPEWEQAWADHMVAYEASEAVKKNVWPLKAEDMREVFRNQTFTLPGTMPEGVVLACTAVVGEPEDGVPRETPEGNAIHPWIGPKDYESMEGQYQAVCEIVSVQDEDADGNQLPGTEATYTVKMPISGHKDKVVVTGVPHHAIVPVHQPYQSDVHHPSAFRHYIGIEDNRFPQMWRNLRDK